jgi:hypothetical protein
VHASGVPLGCAPLPLRCGVTCRVAGMGISLYIGVPRGECALGYGKKNRLSMKAG